MNERLKPGRQVNAEEPNLREKAEKLFRLIVAVPLIGSGLSNAVDHNVDRRQEQPSIEFTIPGSGSWQKIGGEYEKHNIWIAERAQEFLNKNPIHLDIGIEKIGTEHLKKFKRIEMDIDPFYESTIVIKYFNKDGKGGKRVQIRPTSDGKLERGNCRILAGR